MTWTVRKEIIGEGANEREEEREVKVIVVLCQLCPQAEGRKYGKINKLIWIIGSSKRLMPASRLIYFLHFVRKNRSQRIYPLTRFHCDLPSDRFACLLYIIKQSIQIFEEVNAGISDFYPPVQSVAQICWMQTINRISTLHIPDKKGMLFIHVSTNLPVVFSSGFLPSLNTPC